MVSFQWIQNQKQAVEFEIPRIVKNYGKHVLICGTLSEKYLNSDHILPYMERTRVVLTVRSFLKIGIKTQATTKF